MKTLRTLGPVCLLLIAAPGVARAQTLPPAAPSAASPAASTETQEQRNVRIEREIQTIAAALAQTQQQMEQSQRQMQQLQQQLQDLRGQLAASQAATPAAEGAATASTTPPAPATDAGTIDERVQALEAAVKLHDQTKVESASKYPVRVTGLILFNGFLNRGVADNIDLPAYALRSTSTSGTGSLGAGLRQTILGIEADGPHIGGARTSANISIDFFSDVSYTSYGTSAGVVRMRTANAGFDWTNDSLDVGIVAPLISPLSPDSFATVAEPSLAGAGNLWTWAPQLRYTHRLPLRSGGRMQFEFGLWDSPSAGYNSNQLFRTASPAELSEQPAYESRISYAAAGEHGLQLGIGGYYSRQSYPGYQGYIGTEHIDSWAVTGDWRLPFARHFELSGEGYRGRSVGGLGGGVYKDVVTGTSAATGAGVLQPLDAAGGWSQFKTRFSPTLESNFGIGQDDGFARDFHAVVLSPTATATQLRARNRMVTANLIFRPKTYIILSPEYRHIWSWPINSPASTLDIFTLSAGFQF